jgi:heptosyltransferase-2
MAPLDPITDSSLKRLLIVMPSWVGDVVMATPLLRSLRQRFPHARITLLIKAPLRPLIDASPWHDRVLVMRRRRKGAKAASNRRRSLVGLAARLRAGRFDAAILLPNSIRSAVLTGMAGIPRRVGYDRDGRGFLLTDRLLPLRQGGKFVPVPLVDYYLAIARYLGGDDRNRQLELFTRPELDAEADALLRSAEIDAADRSRPIVMLNPGAATKGAAKLWPADRYGQLADQLIERHRAVVLVNGSPKERPILDAVHAAAKHRLIDLPRLGSSLGLLKSLMRRSRLLITNDTGARHIAAAMATPVVSLFGPTDPQWTIIDFPHEKIIYAPPHTEPDGSVSRRMTDIDLPTVYAAAEKLLTTVTVRSELRTPNSEL